jgi:hypothetical protein
MKNSFIIIMTILLICGQLCASDKNTFMLIETDLTKEQKVLMTNAIGLGFVTYWGITEWDYFKNSPKEKKEGWFSQHTKEGGADKFGHFYTCWALSHMLSGIYRDWGYSEEKGLLLGSVSSFTIMGWMELGDSFSEYGFSHEDFIMNTLGCASAYFIGTNPSLADKIDFRIEYWPMLKKGDIFTDYENLKYLMALKLEGFKSLKPDFLDYFELHLGYYARGYDSKSEKERNLFVGIGLNMPKIFKDFSFKKVSKAANFIQIPFTRISAEEKL